MAKERNQDLGVPNDEALEKHVREMLDVNVPDPPSAPPLSKLKSAKKPVTISVTDHSDVFNSPSDLEVAIEETNNQLAAQAGTAPLVSKKKPTKVVITHFDEEQVAEEPLEEVVLDEPLLEDEEIEPIVSETVPAVEIEEPKESPLEQVIESIETDKAVSDIVANESDELLAANDQRKASESTKIRPKKKSLFYRWRHSSAARWATFLIVFAALVGVAATPDSRYFLLNAAGVQSAASLTVLDQSTQQPLKNVKVTLGGKSLQTDADGKVGFSNLKLGPTELVIERRAFAEVRKSITIGWGTNPLGDFNMTPKGSQYTFTITDIFSGKPIDSAEAVLDDSSANANEKGEITLTLDERNEQQIKITIKAPGYRQEIIDISSSNKQKIAVTLTPSHKVSFISKRTGILNVYAIDADGKNETLVLEGTGKEGQFINYAPHPVADVGVFVSTRDGKRADDGSSLNSLLFINLNDKTTKSVIESSQIRLIDWVGSRIVYVYIETNASDQDPSRYKLMSYDYISGDNRQLAVANYFNDIVSMAGKIYYSPASAFQNGINVGVFAVQPDGSGKQPVINQEAWNVLRTSYNKLTLAVQQDWYEYAIGDSQAIKLSGQPSNTTSRVYSDNPGGTHSVWIDDRDGKGTLVVYDINSKVETVLYAQNGVRGPIRWLNDSTLVFRVATQSETADYVVSIAGGVPKKISDVTNTVGIDRWSY